MPVSAPDLLLTLGSDYEEVEEASLQGFIDAADLVVTEDLAGTTLSQERKDLINKYMAAHFTVVAIERGGLVRTKTGESTDTYREGSDSDRGYYLTRFGQQAVALDTSGTLALNASPTGKAEFRVV